ncbi:MAG: hypothetical protein K5696_04555 [Lachnospiraceae bacterium]|nr:hypothetical protein [Lachnospiraceae bacterium]
MAHQGGSAVRFFGEQRAITGRRLPLLALSILMYFLYDVFGTVMAIQRERAAATPDALLAAQTFPLRGAQIVSSWMGLRSSGMIIALTGALLLGIQGFSYLNRAQTVDFYESRPERRGVRFRNIVINSVLIYAVPSMIGLFLSFFLALINGCAAGWLLAEMLIAWCLQSAMFLAMYAMSTTASLLTGTTVTAVLMNAFFFGIEALIRLTVYYYRYAFYATFDAGGDSEVFSTFFTLPPWHYANGLTASQIYDVPAAAYDWSAVQSGVPAALPGLFANLLIFCLGVIAAFFIHRARKAEFAGMAVTYRGVAVFVKFTAGTMFSLVGGLFVSWIFGRGSSGELSAAILTILVTVAVGCMLLEAVFAFNVRQAFYRFWQAPVIAVIALAILFVYRTDAFGYDRWIPGEESVESAWLLNDQNDSSWYDENGNWTTRRSYVEKNMALTDVEDLRTLARIAQAEQVRFEHRNRYLLPEDQTDADTSERFGWDVTLGWRLKNNKTVSRHMRIPESIDSALMDRIIGTKEYTDGYYVLSKSAEEIRQRAARNYAGSRAELSVSTEHGEIAGDGRLADGFYTVYRQDLAAHYDFSLASGEAPVGVVMLRSAGPGPYYGYTYPLFACYTATIGYLSENDLWNGGFLSPEELDSVQVSYSGYVNEAQSEDWVGTYVTKRFTDREEIREIFAASVPTTFESVWRRRRTLENTRADSMGTWDVQVCFQQTAQPDITGAAEAEPLTTTTQREFLRDRVPDFVKEMTAE